MKNKKYDLGIKRFEKAISNDNTNIYALHGKGQCFYEKGLIEEAINTYDKALKIKPDYSNALNSKANALDKLNKKNEALEVYQIINEIKPPNAIYKLNFALCLFDLERFDESENILNDAEKLFEEQKNNFEEDIINKFEKNVLNKSSFLKNVSNNTHTHFFIFITLISFLSLEIYK